MNLVEILNEEQERLNREEITKVLASIPTIDDTKAKKLCSTLNAGGIWSLRALLATTRFELLQIKGIGPVSAESIHDGLKEARIEAGKQGGGELGGKDGDDADGSDAKDATGHAGHSGGATHGSEHLVGDILDATRKIVGRTKKTIEDVVHRPQSKEKSKETVVEAQSSAGGVTIESVQDERGTSSTSPKAGAVPGREDILREFMSISGITVEEAVALYKLGYSGLKDLMNKTLASKDNK